MLVLVRVARHLLTEGEAEVTHNHLPEDRRELLVCQAQGPQAQVGGSIRDTAEHVLNGMNDLVDHDLRHHTRAREGPGYAEGRGVEPI